MRGRPWTDAERSRLLALSASGASQKAMAAELDRSPTSVGTQLYALRHPDRAEAIQRAYQERQGDRLRERSAEHYRRNRPRLVALHRAYYEANRDQVLSRQAERRQEDPEHVRRIRRASSARTRDRHWEAQKARNALAKARAGDGRHLAKLTGLSAEDALFWLPRLPAGCVARAIVGKLREIAAYQEETRPQAKCILTGERVGEPRRGNFGVVVPFGRDWG